MVGPVTGISLPQLSYTTGTVGITASAAQATVEEPAAGSVNVGGVTCYKYMSRSAVHYCNRYKYKYR